MATITTPLVQKPATDSDVLRSLGLYPVYAFIFFYVSGLLDVTLPSLRLPMVLMVVAILVTVLSGRVHLWLQSRVGVCYLALTCWFAAGAPLGVWRGGSVGVLKDEWLRCLLVWIALAGLISTYDECKSVLNTIGFSSATAAVVAAVSGAQSAEGRLIIPGGRLANPNDLALVLLIGFPYLWHAFQKGERAARVRRWAALAAGFVTAMMFLKAGSRSAVLSVIVIGFLIFLRAPLLTKMRIAVMSVVLVAIAVPLIPSHLRHRYTTFNTVDDNDIESQVESTAVGAAAGSSQNRMLLLEQSLSITLKKPVFGVGIGNFPVYVNNLNQELGRPKEPWHGTHNTYTQLSSEAGIPALVLFIAILVMSWRSLNRVLRATAGDLRPRVREIRATAQAAQLGLGALAFFLFFAHSAYSIMPHLLICVAICVARAAQAELQGLGPAPAAAPAPAMRMYAGSAV